MAHLKCKDHSKRVCVLTTRTVHKADNGTCTSSVLLIDKQQTTPNLVRQYSQGLVTHFHAFNRG